MQALQVGLVLVDPEGQIQFVNPHFWELFGLAPRAIPGPGARDGPPLVPADVFIDGPFALADGRVVELDYLVLDQGQGGRLIYYRDVQPLPARRAAGSAACLL